jgi:hypothetical protein
MSDPDEFCLALVGWRCERLDKADEAVDANSRQGPVIQVALRSGAGCACASVGSEITRVATDGNALDCLRTRLGE